MNIKKIFSKVSIFGKKKVDFFWSVFCVLFFFFLAVFWIYFRLAVFGGEIQNAFYSTVRLNRPVRSPTSVLKISFLTDVHSYSVKDKKSKRLSLSYRATSPISEMAKNNKIFQPDFLVEGGDLIDGNRDGHGALDFEQISDLIQKENPNLPIYHVLGNHELRALSKNDWLKMTGHKNTYYYFDVREYRIVVLDGNFSPPLPNSNEESENNGSIEYIPGYVNHDQRVWLEDVLKESARKRVIVFLHQPISYEEGFPPNAVFLSNSREMAELFQKYHVDYVFSGHREKLCNFSLGKTNFYLMKGFYKGDYWIENGLDHKSFFYQLTIDESDRLKIEAFYRKNEADVKYSSFVVNDNDYDCLARDQLTTNELNKEGETLEEMEKENN